MTNRVHTITEKIDREVTGMNGAIYVHVDYDHAGQINGVYFSERGKDFSTLDKVFIALGRVVTAIVRGK